MEEYRVLRIGGYASSEASMAKELNQAAQEGWTVAAASGAGDVSNALWVILRRPV